MTENEPKKTLNDILSGSQIENVEWMRKDWNDGITTIVPNVGFHQERNLACHCSPYVKKITGGKDAIVHNL